MKRLCLACLAVSACLPNAPTEKGGDGGRSEADGVRPVPGRVPGTDGTRFLARTPGTTEASKLRLRSFVVKVDAGPIVTRSHLTLVVENPGDQPKEAYLRMPVPPGAAVTRAVLLVENRRMEGAFVSTGRAQEIYRSITERRRDPALITWVDRDFVDVSIFPVEAQRHRQLELEWTEPTAGTRQGAWYRVPFVAEENGSPWWPHELVVNDRPLGRMIRPWILVPMAAPTGTAMGRLPGDPHAYAIAPAQPGEGLADHILFVAETSQAVGSVDRAKQRWVMEQLARALPDSARVSLLAVDFLVHRLMEKQTPTAFLRGLSRLDDLPSLGALDLSQALTMAAEMARTVGADHVVYLGPGRGAFPPGARQPGEPFPKGTTWFVLGGADPSDRLAELALQTRGRVMRWSSPHQGLASLRKALRRRPSTFTGAVTGDAHPLETVTGQTYWLHRFVGDIPPEVPRVSPRALEALWARARAEAVGADGDPGSRHRVLTPDTAILVLEKDEDYRRWGLPLPGQADDGETGAAGVKTGLLERQPARERPGPSIFGRDRAAGATVDVLGGLVPGQAHGISGLAGLGSSGDDRFAQNPRFARGEAGKPAHRIGRRNVVIDLPLDRLSVLGALDPVIIRRLLKRHSSEVCYCHDAEAHRNPVGSGEMSLQFVIGATGRVLSGLLLNSSFQNSRLENCVLGFIKRWEFPKPNSGGITMVSWSLRFTAGWPGSAISGSGSKDRPEVRIAPWPDALALYRGPGPRFARLQTIAAKVGAPASSPATLAWWIVEHHLHAGGAGQAGYRLAANLLRDEGRLREAVRLISELATWDAATATRELRAWGREEDAKRIQSLTGARTIKRL